jgi:hypothetical protein
MLITRCDPVDGQQWTDGFQCYSDDGQFNPSQGKTSQDLVEYIGMYPPPKPPSDNTFEIERLREELLQSEKRRTTEADARSQSEALRVEQAAEIERLQAELKAERADTHRRLTTAHNNHNLHVAGLKAEHRGESAGLQTAIRLILEKLDA